MTTNSSTALYLDCYKISVIPGGINPTTAANTVGKEVVLKILLKDMASEQINFGPNSIIQYLTVYKNILKSQQV